MLSDVTRHISSQWRAGLLEDGRSRINEQIFVHHKEMSQFI